jgi:hypothetical protein
VSVATSLALAHVSETNGIGEPQVVVGRLRGGV